MYRFQLFLVADTLAAGIAGSGSAAMPGHHYRVGQHCKMTKAAQALYLKQHLTCVKGVLQKMK